MSIRTLLAASFLLTAALPAQNDMRDEIRCTDGKVVTGRVAVPTAPDVLLVLQGGKRVRIDRADIASLDLVGHRIREFCQRRVRLAGSLKAQQFLMDWAETRELPGLARAQALLLACDHDLEEAHEFLGHRKTRKGWHWLYDGKHLPRSKFDERIAKKGFELAGERFVVRSKGDVRGTTAALLDLEHLGVAYYETFGAALQLEEVRLPVRVEIAADVSEFQKWGFRPVPYYEPRPHSDRARTYFAGLGGTDPERLFFTGTQGLLYRSMIGEASQLDDRDRVCAWLEVGLGMHMENVMQGLAGFAAPGDPKGEAQLARISLGRSFRLSALIHLPMYGGFYLLDDTATAIHWASSTMFATWLLDPDNVPPTRDRFLAYVREALAKKKGDSSSLFDQTMGERIEEMEEPFREWLIKKAK